jgi:hypothetical protein
MRRNLRRIGFTILVASTIVSFSSLTVAQVIPTRDLFSWTDAKSCQPFIPAVYYLANTNARSVVAGDFNGDGILDFAVATLNKKLSPTLTILLGKRDGTFVRGKTYAVGPTSIRGALAVGDFNGDGKLDIVTANSSAVVVFLGNGDGTFQAAKASAANETVGIAVGDFNQDGKLDLAIAEFNSVSDVQVLLGKGDGTFQAAVNYPVTAYPTSIAVADFNRDGHLDLAVANGGAESGNTVSVVLGNGDGTFRPKVDYVVGYDPFAITAADLNGDGSMDMATANYVSGTASVLLNKGDGTFRPATSYAAGHPFAPYSIAAAPLEPGSKPSLAVATIAGTYILVNNGNGKFKAAQGYEPVSTGVVLADFNGDGKADLAVAGGNLDEGGSGGVTIIFGKGHGAFATPTAYVAAPNLGSVTVGDFNGDGKPDLAATGNDGGPLAILLGDGKGHFSQPAFYDFAQELGSIASGDFNRDGKLDLAVVTGLRFLSVQILLGNGDGTFTPGKAYRFTGGGGRLALADFNDDRILDIAVSSSRTVSILLGNGDGAFKHASTYAADGGLAVADFNGDGKLDLAVTNSGNGTVSIYLGYGNGTFKNTASYSLAFNPSAVAVADFNGDGKVDLAVGAAPRMGAGDMEILLGNGDGTFQAGTTFNGGYAPVAADFNGDGKVDLATLTLQGFLQVLFGNGDGTFTTGMSSSIGQFTDFFTLADLDGDGASDLVVPNDSGGEVSVLLNQCGTK